MHKFSKNLGFASKFYVTEGLHTVNSILRSKNIGTTVENLVAVANLVPRFRPYVIVLQDKESNPDIGPMFLHPKLWQYIKGGSKSKYSIIGKFYSQIFIGAKLGWC